MSGHGNRDLSGISFSINQQNYQFITTTINPSFLESGSARYYFGSGISLPLPNLKSTTLSVKPIGSTKQNPPEENPNIWTYIEEPLYINEIPDVYNTLLKKKFSYLSNGYAPELYQLTNSTADNINVTATLLTNSLSEGISFLGSKMLLGSKIQTLTEAVGKLVKSTSKPFPIVSNDYITQAFLHKVTNLLYGNRTFIIFSNADGSFQAVPAIAPVESPNTINEYINPLYVKSATPNYPAWVYPFVNFRSTVENTGRLPLNPMYEWSFNQDGTKAIGMMVERSTFTGTQKILDFTRTWVNVTPDDRVYETDTGNPVKVNANLAWFGSGASETVATDRLGMVELGFSIILTGTELDDFDFSVEVLSSEAPTDTAAQRMRVAYAKPLQWTNGLATDDVVSLYLELFETPEAARYRGAQDGVYGLEVPQYGRWSIRSGETELLAFNSHYFQLDAAQLPYCSLQDMATAEHYTTELVELDLGSLSFYRRTKARIPEYVNNPDGWDQITKTTATRTDLYVFGELVETKTAGNATVLEKINEYLEVLPELNPVLPTLTTTIRARYYDFDTQRFMLAPWWGEVLRVPITASFMESLYVQLGSSQIGDGTPTGVYSALNTITEENFIEKYFSKLATYDEADITYGIYDPYYSPSNIWPSLDMLGDANSEFDSAGWQNSDIAVNDVAWFLYRCLDKARKNSGLYGSVLGDEYNRVRNAVAAFHSSDAGIYSSIEIFSLLDIGRTKTRSDHLVVRDYPIGLHWFIKFYRLLLVNNPYEKIITHPNKHYSAFYKDQDYLVSMPEMEVGAEQYPNPDESVIIRWYGNYDHSDTVPAFSSTSVDPLLIDRIGFWDENIVTSHVELHNQAFGTTEILTDYYPASCFDVETTATKEPILIVNGQRVPCNYWNNLFFRAVMSSTANTQVKDDSFAVARARIAPLWG